MSPTLDQPTSGPAEILALLRRRKRLVVLAVVLVPIAGVLFSLTQQHLYSATAKVLLSEQNLANSLTGTPDATLNSLAVGQFAQYAQTQASLAHSQTVAASVLEQAGLHDHTPQQLLDNTSIAPESNTDLLDFSVTDPNRELARTLAADFSQAFVAYRLELDTSSLQRAEDGLNKRIRAVVAGQGKSSGLYQSLVEKQQQLQTLEALQTANATVVSNVPRADQVQPQLLRNALLGLGLGIALAIALAFIRDALDTRLRTADEAQQVIGAPLLARLPAPPKHARQSDLLMSLAEPDGAGAESFRMLRAGLAFSQLAHEAKVIMVTSAVEREGKSTTAANLAVTLARAGRRVVLVDCDFRRPYAHRFFNLEQLPGVSDVALGDVDLEDALRTVALGEDRLSRARRSNGDGRGEGLLRVLPSGATPPSPGEFVGTPVLGDLLESLRDDADVVIVDAPPILHVGDAIALSPRVDGLIVVVRLDVVRRTALREGRRLLDSVPTPVLGFVVTGESPNDGYGAYGYGHDEPKAASKPEAPSATARSVD